MKKAVLLFVLVLLVLAILYAITQQDTPTQTQQVAPENASRETEQETSCDSSLWEHVYHGEFPSSEDRLRVINPCVTVSGVIRDARKEQDGDWHVLLELDEEFSSLLNEANLTQQYGFLVLEPMCSNPVTQRTTIDEGVCEDFAQDIFSPDMKGQRVVVTGAYVKDRAHGWMEIHPVTSITPMN